MRVSGIAGASVSVTGNTGGMREVHVNTAVGAVKKTGTVKVRVTCNHEGYASSSGTAVFEADAVVAITGLDDPAVSGTGVASDVFTECSLQTGRLKACSVRGQNGRTVRRDAQNPPTEATAARDSLWRLGLFPDRRCDTRLGERPEPNGHRERLFQRPRRCFDSSMSRYVQGDRKLWNMGCLRSEPHERHRPHPGSVDAAEERSEVSDSLSGDGCAA